MLTYATICKLSYADLTNYVSDINNYYRVTMKKHQVCVFSAPKRYSSVYDNRMRNIPFVKLVHSDEIELECLLPTIVPCIRYTDGSPCTDKSIITYDSSMNIIVKPRLFDWVDATEYFICPVVNKYVKPIFLDGNQLLFHNRGSLEFIAIPTIAGYPDTKRTAIWSPASVMGVFNLNPLKGFLKELRDIGMTIDTSARLIGSNYVDKVTSAYFDSMTELSNDVGKSVVSTDTPIAELKKALSADKYNPTLVASLSYRVWSRGSENNICASKVQSITLSKDATTLVVTRDYMSVSIDFKQLCIRCSYLGIIVSTMPIKSKGDIFNFVVYATYRASTKTYADVDSNETGSNILYFFIGHFPDSSLLSYLAKLPDQARLLYDVTRLLLDLKPFARKYCGASAFEDSLLCDSSAVATARVLNLRVDKTILISKVDVNFMLVLYLARICNWMSSNYQQDAKAVRLNGKVIYEVNKDDVSKSSILLDVTTSTKAGLDLTLDCKWAYKSEAEMRSGELGFFMPNVFQPYVRFTGDHSSVLNANSVLYSAEEFSGEDFADYWESYLLKSGTMIHLANSYLMLSMASIASVLLLFRTSSLSDEEVAKQLITTTLRGGNYLNYL